MEMEDKKIDTAAEQALPVQELPADIPAEVRQKLAEDLNEEATEDLKQDMREAEKEEANDCLLYTSRAFLIFAVLDIVQHPLEVLPSLDVLAGKALVRILPGNDYILVCLSLIHISRAAMMPRKSNCTPVRT